MHYGPCELVRTGTAAPTVSSFLHTTKAPGAATTDGAAEAATVGLAASSSSFEDTDMVPVVDGAAMHE